MRKHLLLTDFGRNFEQATVEQMIRTYSNLASLLKERGISYYETTTIPPFLERERKSSFNRRNVAAALEKKLYNSIEGDYVVYTAIVDPTTGQRYDGGLHRKALISEKNINGTKVYVVAPDNGIHEAIDPDRLYIIDQDIINWLALEDGKSNRETKPPVIAGPPVWQGGFTYGPSAAVLLLTGNPYFIADDYHKKAESFEEHSENVIEPARNASLVGSLEETLEVFSDELKELEYTEFPLREGSVDHNGNRTFDLKWPFLDRNFLIAGVSLWAERKGEKIPVAYLPLTGSYLPDVSSPKPSIYGVLSSWGYSDGNVNGLGVPWLEAFVYEGKFDEHLDDALRKEGLSMDELNGIRVHYFPNEKHAPAFLREYRFRKGTDWNSEMRRRFLERLERNNLI